MYIVTYVCQARSKSGNKSAHTHTYTYKYTHTQTLTSKISKNRVIYVSYIYIHTYICILSYMCAKQGLKAVINQHTYTHTHINTSAQTLTSKISKNRVIYVRQARSKSGNKSAHTHTYIHMYIHTQTLTSKISKNRVIYVRQARSKSGNKSVLHVSGNRRRNFSRQLRDVAFIASSRKEK